MASLTLQIFCLIATGLLTVHGLTPLLATTPGGCLYRGQYYPLGSFQASPCDHCQCTFSGQAYCSPVNCFFGECVDQVYDKNHCCPVCKNKWFTRLQYCISIFYILSLHLNLNIERNADSFN